MAGSRVEWNKDTAVHSRAPEHLNSSGLRIGHSSGKGRGVYAARTLEPRTVVEISPVLLFSKAEYEEHGRHTLLDHYTFRWRDGRMALALGLGSLFNHSQQPNVSYTLDTETESIRYMTTRRIQEGDELCIFYGHKLWFDAVDAAPTEPPAEDPDDGWGGLAGIEHDQTEISPLDRQILQYADGNPQSVIAEDELPFTRIKLVRDDEEDELSAVITQPAWVADVPDARHTATTLSWLKKSGLETPTMSHLKRIRKQDSKLTILLALTSECPQVPTLPDIPGLSEPYTVEVPCTVALTQVSLKHKNTFWPTIYAPRRKGEVEEWTRGRVLWACEAMKRIVKEAQEAGRQGELPIAAYVPIPYEEETAYAAQTFAPFLGHDTRTSTNHPLRHAVLNTIRAIADYRASSSTPIAPTSSLTPSESSASILLPNATRSSTPAIEEAQAPRNGAHYLLTSLTLFTTHEPCIMCSMALLHSRVKEVIYLIPMSGTGGCGSVACVPALKGVNHRFNVGSWKGCESGLEWANEEGITIQGDLDA
ncbi:uncharacterized protein B0H18DRAFT_892713 [Fomitopsis serialis]|uniref:uncharacterized protein n=1 Tax=Fomitopsis serialis TaxID=139415 RepID=UPI0020086AD9|nr:uncharacterized protein B0H18DRAFT_892713 [Neoantrodia serialis]KAH9911503.1 hypothetical protein B0H18DRAFT_892713 [Neoantrodia serialis]